MNFTGINFHLNAYKDHNQIFDAAEYLVNTFNLGHENFAGFAFRDEFEKNSILLTAEGVLGKRQTVKIPRNFLDFDLNLILNLLAHEMLHVKQKAPGSLIEDKNEREWQAYCEMLFHKNFPLVPDAPHFNRKQFAEKALVYYERMGKGSELQQKYAAEKTEVEKLLNSLSLKKS